MKYTHSEYNNGFLFRNHFSTFGKVLIYVIPCVLLLPTIFFTLSNDHAIFLRGGQALLDGKSLYAEYVDIKPPLIFYVMGFIRFVFGESQFAPRIFDYILQIGTCLSIAHLMKKVFDDDVLTLVSVTLYSISYVALGTNAQLNCELLISPLLVLVLNLLTNYTPKQYEALMLGLLCGLIGSMKYSLFVVLGATILVLLFTRQRRFQETLFQILLVCAMAMLVTVVTHLSLFVQPGSWDGFWQMIVYLKEYSLLNNFGVNPLKFIITQEVLFFGDHYSFILVVSALAGVVYVLMGESKTSPNSGQDSGIQRQNFLLSILVLWILLMISILIEKKLTVIHHSRLYPLLILISSIGIVAISRSLYTNVLRRAITDKHTISLQHKATTLIFVLLVFVFVCVFSPLPRYINLVRYSSMYFLNQQVYNSFFNADEIGKNFTDKHNIVAYLQSHTAAEQRVMVIGIGDVDIYEKIHEPVWSKFSQSQFYFANGVPQVWKNLFYQELTIPTIIVVSTNDYYTALNQHNFTSYESLQRDTTAHKYFSSHFIEVFTTKTLKVFRRIRD